MLEGKVRKGACGNQAKDLLTSGSKTIDNVIAKISLCRSDTKAVYVECTTGELPLAGETYAAVLFQMPGPTTTACDWTTRRSDG